MNLTALDILNKYEGFEKLATKDVDLITACSVAKNIKELSIHKEVIDKKRNELILKYAIRDEEGNLIQDENGSVRIDNSDVETFNKEIYEFLNTEIDVDLKKISIDKLSELKVSPSDIVSLLDILE